MTHLEITAVRISGLEPQCCHGLVQVAEIGYGGILTSAREIAKDLRFGAYAYFFAVGNQLYDIVTGACLTCGAPYLSTDQATPHDNALMALPRL